MTQTERKQAWQQHITDCRQESGEPAHTQSGFVRVAPTPDTGAGLTVPLPGDVSITVMHAGNIEC